MTGSDILFCQSLNDAEKLTLLHIWVDCDRSNDCNLWRKHISIDLLCRRTGFDQSRVIETVKSLITKGLFFVHEVDLGGQPDDYIYIDTNWSKWDLLVNDTVDNSQPTDDNTQTDEIVAKAEKLAYENYETWGNWVVECFTAEELAEDLKRHASLEAWVKHREDLAGIYDERSKAW